MIKSRILKALLLSLTIAAVSHSYCQGSFSGSYSPCTFSYDYQDINCTVFNFNSCTWEQCVQYQTVGNDTYCVAYQTFSYIQWNPCMHKCCDSSKTYDYQYSSFQQCQDDKKSIAIKIGIIIGSVFGGVILIVIIVCCLCKNNRFGDCCRNICSSACYLVTCRCLCKERVPEDNQIVNNVEENKIQLQQIPRWKIECQKNQKLNETCCICLEPGPNLQLQCGHIYHRQCIIACINKKEECILCRSTNFNNIRVYCEGCFAQFMETTLKQHRDELSARQQMCDACRSLKL